MGEEPETVLGEIPVFYRLALGSERLMLFPTNGRIIVARVGKRGAGALATTSFFGRLSDALEDLFKSGREVQGKRKLKTLSPAEILAHDKSNFFVRNEEIVRVEVNETQYLTNITILTLDDKFEFSTRSRFSKVTELLGGLGSKLVSSRLSSNA